MKKTLVNLTANVIIKFGALFLSVFTTRWLITNLSDREYASYNLITAYTAIILAIIGFGIPNLIQKFYTTNQNIYKIQDIWTTLQFLRFISYFVGVILVILSYPLARVDNLFLIIGVFTAQFVLTADISFRSICDAKGKSWQFATTDFFSKLSLLILLYVGTYNNYHSLLYFIYSSICVYLLYYFIDNFWQRHDTVLGSFSVLFLKNNIRPIFYLSASGLLFSLFITTDKLFLAYFGFSDNIINSYSSAYKLYEVIAIVPALIMPVIASGLRRSVDSGKPFFKISNYLAFQNKYVVVIEGIIFSILFGVSLSVISYLLSPIALRVLGASVKYPLSLEIMPILIIGIVAVSANTLLANLVVFLNHEKYELIGGVIMAVITVSGYVITIPNYGAYGAAWVTVVTTFFDLIVLKLYFIFKSLKNYEAIK
jgi:O-antigen/teichoic acid export membrane protein